MYQTPGGGDTPELEKPPRIVNPPLRGSLKLFLLFIGLGLGSIAYCQGRINDSLTQALSSTEGAMRGEESTQGIYTTTTSGSDDPLDMPGWMTGKKTESIRDDPDNTYIGTKETEDAINKVSHGAELRGIHDGSSSHRIV